MSGRIAVSAAQIMHPGRGSYRLARPGGVAGAVLTKLEENYGQPTDISDVAPKAYQRSSSCTRLRDDFGYDISVMRLSHGPALYILRLAQ